MTPVDSLLLDAKQAILDEQHRRFRILHREGRLDEALQQLHVTVSCANDLLNESLRLLAQTLESHGSAPDPSDPPPSN
jgi:hypothetical protein